MALISRWNDDLTSDEFFEFILKFRLNWGLIYEKWKYGSVFMVL